MQPKSAYGQEGRRGKFWESAMKLTGISYVSPVVRYDPDARVVVVQRRDTATGKVSQQFPSEEAVRDLRMDVLTGAAPKPAPERTTTATDPAPGGESVSLTV
jgi:hypothetical protein